MTVLTGLFLGAGATYEVGMPLVWEVTSELREWLTPEKLRALNEHWRANGGEHSDVVIEDVVGVLVRPELHYESILGYIETQWRRPNPSNLQQDYHGMYAWLVEIVYYILYFRHINNATNLQDRIRLLDGIAHLALKNAPLWIFELNHDLMIETLAARHKIPLCCGFTKELVHLPRRDSSGNKIGELTAETISAEQLDRGGHFLPHGESGINLLKIHGSLDVFTFREGKDLLRVLPVDESPSGVFEGLRIANAELIYSDPGWNGPVKVTNEIAYADDAGEMQFLRRTLLSGAYKFDTRRDQVLPVRILDHFRDNLNVVSELICIGYGFGDLHINQIIREWLEFTAERRLQIVGPAVKDIPSALLHLAPQVQLHNLSATDFLDDVAGIERTRMEQVQRRFANWSRSRKPGQGQSDFADFMQKHMQSVVTAGVEKLSALPTRDGDVDVAALGCTPEEYAKRITNELGVTTEGILEAFLASRIAEAAYLRWRDRGGAHGGDLQDWLDAERALRLR